MINIKNQKHQKSETSNYRNGYNEKSIKSKYGTFDVSIPRDRDSSFEPQLVKKREVLLDGSEDLIAFLAVSVNASSYSIVIDVQNLKANGKNWDPFGNAPDIFLKIDGVSITIFENCKNEYRCVMEFDSDVEEWYIEVYDKDKMASDIIGRGNCAAGETCEFGQVKMRITK